MNIVKPLTKLLLCRKLYWGLLENARASRISPIGGVIEAMCCVSIRRRGEREGGPEYLQGTDCVEDGYGRDIESH